MTHAALATTSTPHHKAVVRGCYAALDTGNLDEAFALLTPDYLVHLPDRPEPVALAEYERTAADMYRAFPDLQHAIEEMVAEGDRVAVRLTARGTQRGALGALPATGRPMAIVETAFFRLCDSRIAEQWPQVDTLGMLQQLGAMPRGDEGNHA